MAWWDDLLESAKKTIESWGEPYKPKTTATPSTYVPCLLYSHVRYILCRISLLP